MAGGDLGAALGNIVNSMNSSGTTAGLLNAFGSLGYNSGAGLQNHGAGAAIASMGPTFAEGMASGQRANYEASQMQNAVHQQNMFNAATGNDDAMAHLTPNEQEIARGLQLSVPKSMWPALAIMGPTEGSKILPQLMQQSQITQQLQASGLLPSTGGANAMPGASGAQPTPGLGGAGAVAPAGGPYASNAASGAAPGSGMDAQTAAVIRQAQTYNTLSMLAFQRGDFRSGAMLSEQAERMAGGSGYVLDRNTGHAFAVPGGGQDPNVLGNKSAAETAGRVGTENQMAPREVAPGTFMTPSQMGFPSNGTRGNQPAASQGAGDGFNNAISAIPEADRSIYVRAALNAGMSPDAITGWLATIKQESGFNLNAPRGNSGEYGPGQVMPATGRMLGYSEDALADPAKNLEASALYYKQNYDKSGGDLRKTATGYNTGNPDKPQGAYADSVANTVAGWGGRASSMPPRAQAPAPSAAARPSPSAPEQAVPPTSTLQSGLDAQGNPVPAQPRPGSPVGTTITPIPGGGVTVQNTTKDQSEMMQNDAKEVSGLGDQLRTSQANQVRLLQASQMLDQLKTGPGTEVRNNIAAWVRTNLPGGERVANLISSNDPAAAQEYAKLMLTASGQQEQQVLGARGGYRAIQMYQKANPSLELLPDANRRITNMQLVASQADIDYAQGAQAHFNENQQAYTKRMKNYEPLTAFDQKWNSGNNPAVYNAAIGALNGDKGWNKNLTDGEVQRVIDIVQRAKPGAPIFDPVSGRQFVAPERK